ncbi:hypothetical protein A6M14_03830 [Acinetobacter sp. Ac_877]|uniref:methyltransferase domain-containing protein n=1 Tax=Acinetobacter portensis TaxID=1839785 RepID=UPI00128AEB02|nr:methyltransferase domain-containing protein [Acinetobacter portensis]MPW40440.1 hypothetical protein [Acinetobacter portensis]
MKKFVSEYNIIQSIITNQISRGNSLSPKGLVTHIFDDNSQAIQVLDIGFGDGNLGQLIKDNPLIKHWSVDGIDGFEPNCNNTDLFNKRIYRNVWHGLAQNIPSEQFKKYDLICLLDVIEHLDIETAKWLLRTLLSSMRDDAFLFISTPLWFFPQDTIQDDDLEEHLIAVPATSMMALIPKMYSINEPLIGGFVLGKISLDYIDFFQPIANKNFNYQMGLNIANLINCQYKPGEYIKSW